MKVAVIGAGPAGMTAAYELVKGGADVELFEASADVGGMSRTFELWQQKVDLGPHRFFSSDPRVNRLWREVVGDDYRMVDRLTRIYYRRKFFYYPLQPANALWSMGLAEAAHCMGSYLAEKLRRRGAEQPDSFESWVVERFGRRLFEMFFKSYSEKLWGIPCSELDADFAAQRIKKFSLGEAVKSALGLGGDKHKTLVDRFAYPTGGTGMVYQRMAQYVEDHGGRLHLETPVARVLSDRRDLHLHSDEGRRPEGSRRVRGIELCDGRRLAFDHVVSTMPLTDLVEGIDQAPDSVMAAADSLGYRNTILVYLLVPGTNWFADQWLYIHSPELKMGRMTNFRNWAPELYGSAGSSILALEYWCYDDDPLWQARESDLIEQAICETRVTGLIDDAAVLAGHVVRIHRSYPVYSRGYKSHLDVIVPFLRQCQGLSAIGRYGSFKYNNQDHSILMGLLAAENILHGARHDLWTVNTDYEAYQEAAELEPVKRAA